MMGQAETVAKEGFSGVAAEPHDLDRLQYCGQHIKPLIALLERFGLQVVLVQAEQEIPGSFWGEPEAGLVGNQLFVRSDTPVHSALHEACHYICMDQERRKHLHTDAGGTELEECGVNYLQILLANYLDEIGSEALMQDMDRWGYSFRLGSTKAWFEHDAKDAREWLFQHQLIDEQNLVLFCCRQ